MKILEVEIPLSSRRSASLNRKAVETTDIRIPTEVGSVEPADIRIPNEARPGEDGVADHTTEDAAAAADLAESTGVEMTAEERVTRVRQACQAEVVPPEQEANLEYAQGQQSLSQQAEGPGESPTSEAVNKITPKKRRTINLSLNTPARAGPGPTTSMNRIRIDRDLGPVPQPSPSVFRQFLPTREEPFQSQTDRSIPISQADPILDFSSPQPARRADDAMPTRSVLDPAQEVREVQDESLESEPPRVVKRMIDGEEVYIAWTESMGEDGMVEEDTRNGAGNEIADEGEDFGIQAQVEDYDLALLTSDAVNPVSSVDP